MSITKEAPKITHVYLFENGMCMVFDQYDQQMPEFQGRSEEFIPKIKAAGFAGEIPHGTLRRQT